MEDADRVHDEHGRLGEGSGGTMAAGAPVQRPNGHRRAGAERFERLAADAGPLHAIPVGRAPMDALRIQEVVAAKPDGIVDGVGQLSGEHRLAGTRVAGDAHGHATQLFA